MKDEIKEMSLEERIEKLFESGWVNEFIYLENQLQEARCLVSMLNDERKKLADYITNLQTIEQQYSAILSENAELENKINNLQEENERLKQWDCNKDTRNSRQRVANAKQDKTIKKYKSRIDKAVEYLLDKYVKGLLNDNEVNNVVKILKGEDNE